MLVWNKLKMCVKAALLRCKHANPLKNVLKA